MTDPPRESVFGGLDAFDDNPDADAMDRMLLNLAAATEPPDWHLDALSSDLYPAPADPPLPLQYIDTDPDLDPAPASAPAPAPADPPAPPPPAKPRVSTSVCPLCGKFISSNAANFRRHQAACRKARPPEHSSVPASAPAPSASAPDLAVPSISVSAPVPTPLSASTSIPAAASGPIPVSAPASASLSASASAALSLVHSLPLNTSVQHPTPAIVPQTPPSPSPSTPIRISPQPHDASHPSQTRSASQPQSSSHPHLSSPNSTPSAAWSRRDTDLLNVVRRLEQNISTLDVSARLCLRDALLSLSNKAANPNVLPSPQQEAMNRAAEYLVLRMLFLSGQQVMHTAPGTVPTHDPSPVVPSTHPPPSHPSQEDSDDGTVAASTGTGGPILSSHGDSVVSLPVKPDDKLPDQT